MLSYQYFERSSESLFSILFWSGNIIIAIPIWFGIYCCRPMLVYLFSMIILAWFGFFISQLYLEIVLLFMYLRFVLCVSLSFIPRSFNYSYVYIFFVTANFTVAGHIPFFWKQLPFKEHSSFVLQLHVDLIWADGVLLFVSCFCCNWFWLFLLIILWRKFNGGSVCVED